MTTDGAAARSRMVDEFVAAYQRLGKTLPAAPEICGGFADLCWDPYPSADWEEIEVGDPAFVIQTDLLQLAFHRIRGEIRYMAAPAARAHTLFAAVEMGLIGSVGDAAEFAAGFLEGADFDHIAVPRRLPDWAVERRRGWVNPWPPIDPAQWQSVPCTTGRLATPDDTAEGRALFLLHCIGPDDPPGHDRYRPQHGMSIIEPGDRPGGASPIDIALPRCVLLHEDDVAYPAVAIQAERSPRGTHVGIRFIRGDWLVRPLESLELLDGPTDAFFDEYRQGLARAAVKPTWSIA
jgi:hypothetical protein